MMAFEQGIERKISNCQDCLYYLEQYTRGQPRELVRSCYHMPDSPGYETAERLIKEYYGNAIKITAAYMEKALTWPPIRSEDASSLQELMLFLKGCVT